ncbi:MAG: hypothetical protein WA985_09065 [Erythrobacter sp.]
MMRSFSILFLAAVVPAGCSGDPASEPSPAQESSVMAQDEGGQAQVSDANTAAGTSSADADAPQDAEERRASEGETQDTIPARFHGTYAETLEDCDIPSHGNFTVETDEIDFFESNGVVQQVNVDGDYAAATIDETYADRTSTYVFYMALEGKERLRFRYGKDERMTWVRCP